MIVLTAAGTFPNNSTFITFIEKLTSQTFVFTLPAASTHARGDHLPPQIRVPFELQGQMAFAVDTSKVTKAVI